MARLYIIIVIFVSSCALASAAQSGDKRCICTCPEPILGNTTKTKCAHYNKPVAPSKCNCENMVLPELPDDIKPQGKELCAQCECKYESRNSTTIKVVVILVLWIISLLVVYMLFLLCLDPLLNKRRAQPSYQEHTNEEEEAGAIGGAPGMAQPLRVRPNVLGRVGHQQDKWKRQVQEQRRNIYDRHTMLN